MSDLIRKAVELADGWELDVSPDGHTYDFIKMPAESKWSGLGWARSTYQPTLDALAAQLVRQVDAHPKYYVMSETMGRCAVVVYRNGNFIPHILAEQEGQDRTMNTITAIVESGVLATDKEQT